MRSVITLKCSFADCGKTFERDSGQYQYHAIKKGCAVYCSRGCMGLARRHGQSVEERKAMKSAYDKRYTELNREKKKRLAKAYYESHRDPEKEKAVRQARAPLHAEYIRQPKYKAYKKRYDRTYRANKMYGEWGEVYEMLLDVNAAIASRMSRYEIYKVNGTLYANAQRRKRQLYGNN